MAFKPFVLPSGTDFYAGDGAPSGVADPLFIVADATNRIGINSPTPTGTLDVTLATSGDRGLILRTNTGQATNVLEILGPAANSIYYINSSGVESAVSTILSSGLNLTSGIPTVTTNTLYSSGTTLYWSANPVSTGTTAQALTFASGVSGTSASFNGGTAVTVGLGGSGNLTNLVVNSGITLPNAVPAVTTNNNLYANNNQLYFNGFPVSGGPIGPAGPGGASGNYGSFYDITTQTYPSTTGVTIIGIGQVAEARNISISGGNAMVFNAPGTYSIAYSIQFLNGVSQSQDVDVWLRKNEVDVSGSNTIFTIPPQHAGGSGAIGGICNYIYTFNSGDYIQLASASNSTSVVIAYVGTQSSPTVPSTPSVILTAQQVMYTANAATLTFGSGLSGGTASYYNGSGDVTVNMGGTGTLTQLQFSSGVRIGSYIEDMTLAGDSIGIGNYATSGSRNIAGGYPHIDLISIGVGSNTNAIATGPQSVFIGNYVASGAKTGPFTTYIGYECGALATGVGGTTNWRDNVALGYRAAYSIRRPLRTTFIGSFAGQYSSGNYNSALGYIAGQYTSGNFNTFLGAFTGSSVSGSNNIEILAVSSTASSIIGGNSNKLNIQSTVVGDTSTKRLAIGSVGSGNFSPDSTLQLIPQNSTDKVLIVKGAASQTANLQEWQNSAGTALAYVDSGGAYSGNLCYFSTGNLYELRFDAVNDLVRIGANAGGSASGSQYSDVYIGDSAGRFGYNNTQSQYIGYSAGNSAKNNSYVVALGYFAGNLSQNNNNVIMIGQNAGQSSNYGLESIYIGDGAGQGASGSYNIYIGVVAGSAISTASGNNNLEITSSGSTYPSILINRSNKINIQETIVGDNTAKKLYIGNAGTGNLSPNATLQVQAKASTDKVLIAQGAASQTANIQEWQNSVGAAFAYIDSGGLYSGINASYASGITLISGIPAVTTSSLYASGTTLYWNGQPVSTGTGGGGGGTTTNALTFGSGLSASTAATFNGSAAVTANLGGTGTLNQLTINSASTSNKTLIVKSAAAQTVNLFEVQNSSGSGLLTIDQSGGVNFAPWSGTATSPVRYDGTYNRLVFTGSGTGASGINLNVLSDSSLSFEATAGQLFSIADNLSSGTIFSVNDISGMSSIEVDASGLIKFGEFDGFIGIGTSQLFSQYSGKMEINTPVGYKGLIVRNFSTGAGNLFELQNNSSGIMTMIDSSGRMNIGGTGTLAQLEVDSIAATTKGLIVKGAAAQSANLIEWASTSLTLGAINSGGQLGIGTSSPTGTVDITAITGSTKGLILRSNSTQSVNTFEVTNRSGTPIVAVTASGTISGAIAPTIITSTGDLTLTNLHNGYIIEQTGVVGSGTFTLGTANDISIPGWNCMIVNIGSGVVIASGTNTLRSPGGLNKSRTQYSSISIYRRGTNDFVLGGDLA